MKSIRRRGRSGSCLTGTSSKATWTKSAAGYWRLTRTGRWRCVARHKITPRAWNWETNWVAFTVWRWCSREGKREGGREGGGRREGGRDGGREGGREEGGREGGREGRKEGRRERKGSSSCWSRKKERLHLCDSVLYIYGRIWLPGSCSSSSPSLRSSSKTSSSWTARGFKCWPREIWNDYACATVISTPLSPNTANPREKVCNRLVMFPKWLWNSAFYHSSAVSCFLIVWCAVVNESPHKGANAINSCLFALSSKYCGRKQIDNGFPWCGLLFTTIYVIGMVKMCCWLTRRTFWPYDDVNRRK